MSRHFTRPIAAAAAISFVLAACSGGEGGGSDDTGVDVVDDTEMDVGGLDVGADTADTAFDASDLLPVGELCTDAVECLTGVCLQLEAGLDGFCSSYCFDSGDCPDENDWDCVFLRNSGGDAANLCVPNNFCIDEDGDGFGRGPGCDGPDCDDTLTSVNANAEEVCDGLDNDCDGNIDDNTIDANVACDTGFNGVCAAGRSFCQAGTLSCESARLPSEEVCDGLDNDCDGEIDTNEDGTLMMQECYAGPAGTPGVGRCLAGARSCIDGELSGCVGQVLPITEVCNGFDDDCDGEADENGPGAGITCDTGLLGECRLGLTQCADDGAPVCEQQTELAAEICDGRDNDCDGAVDENEAEDGPLTRDCYGGPDGTRDVGECTGGLQTCEAGSFGTCDDDVIPTIELCNSVDDDCDGEINEGDPAAGFNCSTGLLGVCAFGQTECGGGSELCVQSFEPSVEICDNLDNDCDGEIDENVAGDGPLTRDCYDGAAGTEGVGPCIGGQQVCVGGDFSSCQAQVVPAPTELCDNIDNDCDGTVDNGDPGGGQLCNTGDLGVCSLGSTVCSAGGIQCIPNETASAERCDGLDNDCNGSVDDGAMWANIGDVCFDGQGQCRAAGVLGCDATDAFGPAVCSATPGSSQTEVCDGVDNDCDGSTDEGGLWDDIGTACSRGEGVCQRAGVLGCDTADRSGPAVCSAAVVTGTAEICDGLDNDCNGSIDDGAAWANLGDPCTGGQGTCAVAGVFVCNTTTPSAPAVCDATPGTPTSEICDGFDNDCDGTVDNNRTPVACPLQQGVCAGSERFCAGAAGLLTCNAGTYGPDYETRETTCDGLDNDCDGTVDGLDLDGDGFVDANCGGDDCDDTNPLVYPGATEICGDALDNDCNSIVDDRDVDGDGYISSACGGPDCNDNSSAANPDRTETCGDNIDNDCDGNIDNVDNDGDGFVDDACGGLDCDDARSFINPTADEACDGFDTDCNGVVDDKDLDFDGFLDPACGGDDCDDTNPLRNPGRLEICGDGVDNDCNGAAEDRDIDGDGDFDAACGGTDCDDLNALANGVGAAETCGDGDDNDCNGTVDDRDNDGDGHIDELCVAYSGGLPVDDCNDRSSLANPGEDEVCGDSIDNDCDGSTDNRDIDGDNFIDVACGGTDCNDNQSSVRPGAPEICDNLDNDCNSAIDDKDLDADGHVDLACVNYVGALPADDCDDTNLGVNPERFEVCGNDFDEDCSGAQDDKDIDQDGAVDRDPLCGGNDCDDLDPMSYPGAPEYRDGRNNDCGVNGFVDEGLIAAGDVVITEIFYDSSEVPDENYEWFELYNPTDRPVDMNTWLIRDTPGSSQEVAIVDDAPPIAPRSYATFCRTGAPAFNGGVVCDYEYGFMQLANSADEIYLEYQDGFSDPIVDEVEYDESPWPNASNESVILDPDNIMADNNNPSNWCANDDGPSLPLVTDRGSPGVTNVSCDNPGTPQIVAAHPDNAASAGGGVIRITGVDFVAGTTARVGGTLCSALTRVSNYELLCTVPSGTAGAATISVTNGGGTDTESGLFTYTRTASTAGQRVDSVDIASPESVDFPRDAWSQAIFGTVSESGVTTGSCPSTGEYATGTMIAEVGYGATSSDPRSHGSWSWSPAFCESIAGGAATFRGAISTSIPGTYSFAYRFSVDGGTNWNYSDLNGSNGFSVAELGSMRVR